MKTLRKKCFAVASAVLLFLAAVQDGSGAGQGANAPPSDQEYAPLTPEELDGLVAPIALYPDALVAQILGAATFPDQVAEADGWQKQNSNLTGQALMKVVDKQQWDPAVKALTQFPSVLSNLAANLGWTSALGEASATQQQDVMSAIQRMRAKAYAAGNLKSGSQIKVIQEGPQTIVIQPANPQVVYVPTYNPTVIYGTPVVTPGYSAGAVAATAVLSFGVGIAVGSMISGGCCGWGWGGWGTSWHNNTIVYNRNVYVGNSYWRGGYRAGAPGYRPGYPGYRPGAPGYRPGYPGYRPPGAPAYRPGYPATRPTYSGYQAGARPPSSYANRPPANPTQRPAPYSSASGANRAAANGSRAAAETRPSNTTPRATSNGRELRGYSGPSQNSQGSHSNAFSRSGGGRVQSTRGTQSLGSRSGQAGRSR
jgi:hypothetical protein